MVKAGWLKAWRSQKGGSTSTSAARLHLCLRLFLCCDLPIAPSETAKTSLCTVLFSQIPAVLASHQPASQPVICDSMRRLPVTGFQITCQAPQQLFLSLPFLLLSLRVVGPQTPQMQCNRLTANMSGGPAHLHAVLGPNCQLHYTCEVTQKEFHESLGVLFPCCWQSSRLTSASAGPAGGGEP